jgi:hypothetical protein
MATFLPVWILGASFLGVLILSFSFKGPSAMGGSLPRPQPRGREVRDSLPLLQPIHADAARPRPVVGALPTYTKKI